MRAAYIYQILTPSVSPRELDPGFLVLDNSANPRPDWFEYWPIRNFLLEQSMDENAYYGFLSPKFKAKTNLGAAAVEAAERDADGGADVILLSPSIHNSSYHLNVFVHGDAEHPGLLAISKRFFERIGRSTNLDELVCDSRNTVNSNYFIAKARFWREWFAVTEALFAIAEAPDDPLGAELRAPTAYRGAADVQMKVFVVERIAGGRSQLPNPRTRSVRSARADLQAAGRDCLRRVEDRLRDRGPRTIQAGLSDGQWIAQLPERAHTDRRVAEITPGSAVS